MNRIFIPAFLALAACTGAPPVLTEGASDLGIADFSPPEPPGNPGIDFDGSWGGFDGADFGQSDVDQDAFGDGA